MRKVVIRSKCAKHGLVTNPWNAPKLVCKVWTEADPLETSQEEESGVMPIENSADIDS